MKLELRKASLADAEYIWDLQKTAFGPMLEKYKDYNTNPGGEALEVIEGRIADPETTFFLISREGEDVGAIRMIEEEKKPYKKLGTLMIWPKYWNQGIAQKTFAILEEKYPNQYWVLNTVKQEEKLCRLYQKLGYQQTEAILPLRDDMTIVTFMKNYVEGAEEFHFGSGKR